MLNVNPSIIQSEFIGLEVKVVKSSNPSIIGISGRIIDETRNTFVILTDSKKRVIIKDTSVFIFMLPYGKKVQINGKVVIGRPEDRIKKRPRRLW